MIHYTIMGEPRTKKNHQKIVGTGRRCPCCGKPTKQWIQQGDAYRKYAERAAWQFHPVPDKPIDYPVNCCYLFICKWHIISILHKRAFLRVRI